MVPETEHSLAAEQDLRQHGKAEDDQAGDDPPLARLLARFRWAMVAFNVLDYIVDDFRPYSLMMWLFMLFGEYGLLIGTIPPDETKKRTSSRAAEALRCEGE